MTPPPKQPFSNTKVCYFLKEGDNNFTPLRVPVNTKKYKTIEYLEDDISSKGDFSNAVRSIYTSHGTTPITNIADFQNQGYYIAGSRPNRVKKVDINKVPTKKPSFNASGRVPSGRRADNDLLKSVVQTQRAARGFKRQNGLSTIASQSPTKRRKWNSK